MNRREFVWSLFNVVAWPLAVRAQESLSPVRRVGLLMPYSESDMEYRAHVRALWEELEKLGWTRGANVQFDERWTTDDMDRVRTNAASLMASQPDVVVAAGGRVIPVLMQISRSIPIVIPGAADPVGTGWVANLARPGGNVTGFTTMELSLLPKMLEILKQIAPDAARVALVFNPDNPNSAVFTRTLQSFARPLALELIMLPVHRLADINRAFERLVERQTVAVLFPPDVTINALREEVVTLVAQYRLPAIYTQAEFVKSGGLAFYGASRVDLFRRAAGYIDRILRGERPSDLPFQQPTKYDLVINLKTAKELGLTIPPSLLARADEVIE